MRITAVRRSLAAMVALAAMACASGGFDASEAATSIAAEAPATSDDEIVVLEAPGCIYCPIFRRDVLPSYQASARARTTPLRFLDLNDKAADALALDGPVTIVPTVVILRQHREIARIPGYVGPVNFFHIVDSVLGRS